MEGFGFGFGFGEGQTGTQAALALDFVNQGYATNGTYSSLAAVPGWSFTRASTATAVDSTGTIQSFASGVPARTDKGLSVWESRTNIIRNSSMAGATSSALPTNWAVSGAGGISPTVVGTGSEFGLNYVDIQMSGTPNATASAFIFADGSGVSSGAAQAQVWTASIRARLTAGSLTNTNMIFAMNENTSGGVFITNGSIPFAPTSTFTRFIYTRTLSGATTAGVYQSINITVTSGQPVNFTIRLYSPQLELGAFVTPDIPTTSAAATRAADVAALTTIAGYNVATGTWVASVNRFAGGTAALVIGDTNGSPALTDRDPTNVTGSLVNTGFTATAAAPLTLGVTQKAAYAYQASNHGISLNGATAVDNALATAIVDPAGVHIGIAKTGLLSLNGYMQRLSYYASRLPDAQLQALTQ